MMATLMSFRVKTTDKYSIQWDFGVWPSYNRNSQLNCNTYISYVQSSGRMCWKGRDVFFPRFSPVRMFPSRGDRAAVRGGGRQGGVHRLATIRFGAPLSLDVLFYTLGGWKYLWLRSAESVWRRKSAGSPPFFGGERGAPSSPEERRKSGRTWSGEGACGATMTLPGGPWSLFIFIYCTSSRSPAVLLCVL